MEDFVTVNISSDLIQADYTYYSLLLALYQSQMKQDSQPDSEGDDDGGGGVQHCGWWPGCMAAWTMSVPFDSRPT